MIFFARRFCFVHFGQQLERAKSIPEILKISKHPKFHANNAANALRVITRYSDDEIYKIS